jgi:hypothetical protein
MGGVEITVEENEIVNSRQLTVNRPHLFLYYEL